MTDSGREFLRNIFLLGYDDLKTRLTRRLGSAELAGDALQDAWLRLEHARPIGQVLRPKPYILRIAYNIALKRLRRERTMVTLEEVREELSLVDDAPLATQATESREELALLLRAAEELTPRQRNILFAARLDGDTLQDIAIRFGIPERAVARELRRALLYCGERVGRKVVPQRGPQSSGPTVGEMEE